VTVAVDDVAAEFDPADGTWHADVALVSGLNTFTARAFDADGAEVDAASIDIVYMPPENHLEGELTEIVTLAGAWVFEETVFVPIETALIIEPGTVLLMKDRVSLVVHGQLLAEGTAEAPIHFTHYGDGTRWKQIKLVAAQDSVLSHCVIEYADSEGAHQDYYEPGPRNYHEAVVVLAGHLDVNECTFQNLPDDSARAEGDAIAIISDDPVYTGDATAHIKGCRFLSIGQGVHTRYSYVCVEDCFFTGKRGDNDDVDLWGESTPPPLIQNNVFLSPDHDDAINPTRCSATIIGNFIAHTDDHGIVLRDAGFPVVMNNVVFDCRNGGIAIENSCDAYLQNNTIVGCGRGLRLFDLGRWGPPYRLNPGGGTATVVNCIIWDCATPISLADSSNTEIDDPGSHVTVLYSDIQSGRDGVSISGTHSTVTWGQGNLDVDPLFADATRLDVHLRSEFGRWDPNSMAWVSDETTSPCLDAGDPNTPVADEPLPNGGRVNMGAYGGTTEASLSAPVDPNLPAETPDA
jgi:parallel beta-helix repeat protein